VTVTELLDHTPPGQGSTLPSVVGSGTPSATHHGPVSDTVAASVGRHDCACPTHPLTFLDDGTKMTVWSVILEAA
jgi:hypothetical protein